MAEGEGKRKDERAKPARVRTLLDQTLAHFDFSSLLPPTTQVSFSQPPKVFKLIHFIAGAKQQNQEIRKPVGVYRLNHEKILQGSERASDWQKLPIQDSGFLRGWIRQSVPLFYQINQSAEIKNRIVCKTNRHQHCFGTFSEVFETTSENPELSWKGSKVFGIFRKSFNFSLKPWSNGSW